MEISGERARLLGVDERAQHLFGREELEGAQSGRKKKATQIDLFSVLAEAEDGEGIWSGQATARLGVTTLDDPFRRRPWGGAEAVFG